MLPLLLLLSAASAQDRVLHTDRPLNVDLPLPAEDDAFTFAVFGDRTGGPAEGVKVLAQAVHDTNLVDPDLVMTVGDLINGYNQTAEWMEQMREYKRIMADLTAPWFPVAGNHDTYWRGPNRPPEEHEANYEDHFGPLWYAFEHKGCWFVVLYTDEPNPKTGERNFSKPASQKMSPEQLAFLDRTLTRAADARHVFVFLHHPRWFEGNYGDDWRRVHARLAAAGNVRAVFAGHIHRMVYTGPRDGIEYFTLATVGGGQSSLVPEAGYLHHWNLITVRDEGISCITLPVGAAIDPRDITQEVSAEARTLARTGLTTTASPTINARGAVDGQYELVLRNPVQHPIEASVALGAADSRWSFQPEHGHVTLGPGEERRFAVRARRRAGELDDTLRLPEATLQLDLLLDDARIRIPDRGQTLPLGLGSAPDPEAPDRALALHGDGDHVRVEHADAALPDGPLTLECRFRARSFAERTGLLCKTESCEYGLFANGGVLDFMVHLDGKYVSARARQAVPVDTWHHVAGVFDGAEVRLYVNGTLAARTPARGSRTKRSLPLLIGADTTGSGVATSPFDGEVDEVRLSTVARYAGETLAPLPTRHEPDADTHLLLRCDELVGPWLYDHSPRAAHPRWRGSPTLVPAR